MNGSKSYNDLSAFVVVAREQSFTRAAALLGVSQSALSQTVSALEKRLGVRLLTRTTRSVSPTEAGERLLHTVGPRLEDIDAEMEQLSALRDKPAGLIRINAGEHAAQTILWPKVAPILQEHPDIRIEVIVDQALIDIVSGRYDAGIRLGEQVAQDMIAVRIGPDLSMAAVASPAYFRQHGIPEKPADLTRHNCINLRLPTFGGLYAWEFDKDGRDFSVRVEGQATMNSSPLIIQAALSGNGIAFLPDDCVNSHIASGQLVRVLRSWCSPFSGYHLYFPSNRQASPAFRLVVDALRYRGEV
jgi:DNA-binding transcriptional LysR family regulator